MAPAAHAEDATGVHSHALSFRGVTYRVEKQKDILHPSEWFSGRRETQTILQNANGVVESGQTLAILGSSGSGKTTFLDLIACRQSGGALSGDVLLDGVPCTESLMKEHAGYVMQDDRLLPNLTVKETLWFLAQLRLPQHMDSQAKSERVDSVINELGLRHVADTKVGGGLVRGVSGGERRRVSIGASLIVDCNILFLDEPTTGLDSFTATTTVETLVALAQRNRIVVFTIHQPRSDIFKLFDHVMLLSKGETVYFGPAKSMVDHFSSLNYPCPSYANPLDYFLDVITVDERSDASRESSMRRLTSLVAGYHRSPIFTETTRRMEEHGPMNSFSGTPQHTSRLSPSAGSSGNAAGNQKAPASSVSPHTQRRDRPPWWKITGVLILRQWKNLLRDWDAVTMRMTQLMLFALFLFIFLIRLDDDQASIQNRTGFLYESTSGPMFIGMLNAIALFPTQRDLFYRESRDGLYGSLAFVVSYTIHAIPSDLGSSLLYSVFSYWAIGLQPDGVRFLVFWGVVYLLHAWGESLGMFLLGVFYDANIANSVSALVISASALLASGFLRSTATMPMFLQDIGYAAPHKYASELLVKNEYSGLHLRCGYGEACAFNSGDQYLEEMFPDAIGNNLRNWVLLMVITVSLRICAYFAFKFIRKSLR
eukprot:Opistho-2@5386